MCMCMCMWWRAHISNPNRGVTPPTRVRTSVCAQALHQKHTMEGGLNSLIVKFADPPKASVGAMGMVGAMPGRAMMPMPGPVPTPSPQPPPGQENRLFVGSLAPTAGEKQVREIMEQYGQVVLHCCYFPPPPHPRALIVPFSCECSKRCPDLW
jgi:hypothetical protein